MYATSPGAHQRYSNGIYGIPFRSYYSRDVANLLLAGRDISATHVAFGSTRVMATCGAGGEAAGTGASLALDLGVRPRELATRHVDALRQLVLRQDASVFGIRNTDPDDLARSARVAASSVAHTIDPVELFSDAAQTRFALERDLGILVPVDPRLEFLEVLLVASQNATLGASLWTTGRRQNAVPIDERHRVEVAVAASDEPQWVRLPLEWVPEEPENVVVVLEAAEGVFVVLAEAQVPGVLALPHRPQADGDANVVVEESESVIAWPAIPMRGTAPRLRLSPQTEVYSERKAVGGYQRFYGGPNMWVSQAGDNQQSLTLEWDEPQHVRSIRLVFDDDSDVELNTLHHHRTPDRVFPELVRDYVLEARSGSEWNELVRVEANRRRQRVHAVDASTDAVRLRVLATNGVPQARVVSFRVY
jgi:hypothetical protein